MKNHPSDFGYLDEYQVTKQRFQEWRLLMEDYLARPKTKTGITLIMTIKQGGYTKVKLPVVQPQQRSHQDRGDKNLATSDMHSMSHYSEGERRTVSMSRDTTHAKLLADFFDKLKSSEEPDGKSLFDHCATSFGSNFSSVHTWKNCPTLIAGGGAGFRQGRHRVMDDPKTPLCNLWLSTLQGCGIAVASHGDSTGVIEDLFA